MAKRVFVGLALIVASIASIATAGVAWYSVGLYADATGTGGYIPVLSWVTGILGVLALIAAIWILQTGPTTSRSDQPSE